MLEFQTFLTPERVDEFWLYVKWFLFYGAPIVMIFFATDIVQMVVNVIRGIFTTASPGRDKKDDDDYEVYRY